MSNLSWSLKIPKNGQESNQDAQKLSMTIAWDKTRPVAVFLKCVLIQGPQEGSILLNFLGMNGMLSNSGDKHA